MVAIILSEVVAANTSHFDRPGQQIYRDEGDAPIDDHRRPARISGISNALGIPYETTRRYVVKMVNLKMLVRVKGGVIISSSLLQRPELMRKYRDDHADYRRLAEAIRRLDGHLHKPGEAQF